MPRPWTVAPHGPLRQVDDNLWTVESVVPTIPGGNFPRTMTVVRLADGSLLLHNAVPLDEPAMQQLGALGSISTLLIPSQHHCVDAHAFAERTKARVLCPAKARAEVERVVKVDGDLSALPKELEYESLDGASNGEGVLTVRTGERITWIICDVALVVPHLSGFWGLVWRVMGFTGTPGPSPVWRRAVMSDKEALRAHLRRLADRKVDRLIPSHGAIVERDVTALFRGVADRL